jgi:uncharacterized membrane protein YphA (DoxX/SURF4 family)
MKPLFLIGRIAFGGYFLYNAVNHLKKRKELAQYAASKSVPLPDVAVPAAAIPLLIGGGSILLGFKPKLGTAAIIAFLAAVTPMMHNFWTAEDPQQRVGDLVHFSKNLALLGAALAFAGLEEPWPMSVEHEPTVTERIREFAGDAKDRLVDAKDKLVEMVA